MIHFHVCIIVIFIVENGVNDSFASFFNNKYFFVKTTFFHYSVLQPVVKKLNRYMLRHNLLDVNGSKKEDLDWFGDYDPEELKDLMGLGGKGKVFSLMLQKELDCFF